MYLKSELYRVYQVRKSRGPFPLYIRHPFFKIFKYFRRSDNGEKMFWNGRKYLQSVSFQSYSPRIFLKQPTWCQRGIKPKCGLSSSTSLCAMRSSFFSILITLVRLSYFCWIHITNSLLSKKIQKRCFLPYFVWISKLKMHFCPFLHGFSNWTCIFVFYV